MSIAALFWLLMILVLIGALMNLPVFTPQQYPWFPALNGFLLWFLLFLLGWQVFGFILRGP